MKELQVFQNQEFGEVQIIQIKGKEYFGATNIALALGYSDPYKAIKTHCKERGITKHPVLTNGGTQNVNFIDESNMYRLITNSKLPTAEKFESWVFDEVLPSIRKHGAYMTDNTIEKALNDPDFLIQLATNLKEEKVKRIQAEKERDILSLETLAWTNRKMIDAIIKKYGSVVGFQEAWREFKKELLYKHSINLNSRVTAYLNSTGKKTKPKTLDMIHDEEVSNALSTAVAICRCNRIDISEIINKFSEVKTA